MTNLEDRVPGTIAIVADLPRGVGGGVNAFTRGLTRAMVRSSRRPFRFVVLVAQEDEQWLDVGDRVATVAVAGHEMPGGIRKSWDRVLRYGAAAAAAAAGDLDGARIVLRRYRRQRALVEALRRSPWPVDLIHFPFQDFVETGVPFIFSPWDLQHRHLPDLWPPKVSAERDAYYRRGCRRAVMTVLASAWARDDVVEQYRIPKEKTAVVPVAAPTAWADEVDPDFVGSVRSKYGLGEPFIFYPAATWPHKNHHRLISALASVHRSGGAVLHLACSGASGRNRDDLLAHAAREGVGDYVRFLGFVGDRELRALYRDAVLCVFPSLFEGAGLPVLEAFEEGCPLAASRVTCIPEYVGDAAILFDPYDVEEMAQAIRALADSSERRAELAARGRERVRSFTWARVASDYTDLYTRILGSGGGGSGRRGEDAER